MSLLDAESFMDMEMVGRRVQANDWGSPTGVVVEWTPLSAALCDALLLLDSGSECWFSSASLKPIDGKGPLPNRNTVIKENKEKTLAQLKEIKQQFIEEDFYKPWPGMEFGKAHLANAINAAIEQLEYVDPVHSATSTLGRLGGLAKSEAKAISSRENGKKGGRPKKVREEETIETIEESNLDLFT